MKSLKNEKQYEKSIRKRRNWKNDMKYQYEKNNKINTKNQYEKTIGIIKNFKNAKNQYET